MCGRARQALDWQDLKIKWWSGQPALNMEPRWNAAPRQRLVMIRQHDSGDGAEAVPMRWGFIPSWEKDPKGGRQPINAKAENVGATGMWRDSFRRRRAVFPVNGFYEWQRRGTEKLPYSIVRADGDVMALAALWDRWKSPGTDEAIDTFAVITCPPNGLMAEIHDRMPVILDQADIEAWLSGTPEAAASMLKPCPADALVAYRVSERVGNVRNDSPDIAAPISADQPDAPRILGLFD